MSAEGSNATQVLSVFKAWDVNSAGFISESSLRSVLLEVGIGETAVKAVLANTSGKKDGNVLYGEFWDWLSAPPSEESVKVDQCMLDMADAATTAEGSADLKTLFDAIDLDSNGKVTSKEWGKSLSKNKDLMAKFFGGATMAEIGKAFKRIDTNSDGSLSWEEFVAAAKQRASHADDVMLELAEKMQKDEVKQSLFALFMTLDKDGDGKVTSQEWGKKVREKQAMMAQFFGGATTAEVGRAFRRIDANGDGSLSWEEFVSAAEARRANVDVAMSGLQSALRDDAAKAELAALFETLDKDANGKVTSSELWRALVDRKKDQDLIDRFFSGRSFAEIGQAFRRVDKNANGFLCWEEFVSAANVPA